MALVKPFRGIRPTQSLAARVASPPYDVINSEEARQMAQGNPYSFLHINKPEIDLDPTINLYDPKVYKQGASNFKKMIQDKIFIQDDKPCFYMYRQNMGDHQQTGLVACVSVDEYNNNKIRKHELTRIDKEEDRLNHILSLHAQTGPVFLTYLSDKSISTLLSELAKAKPSYDFQSDDAIQHTFWVISQDTHIANIERHFGKIESLYVADGHHRSAAAARACAVLKEKNPNHTGNEAYNFFLTVIFPHSEMKILDYNRVVKDLNGLSKEAFLEKVRAKFHLAEHAESQEYKPARKHDFGMYLRGLWYRLSAIPGTWDTLNPTKQLDVSILYENLLKPILDIGDPRTDKRIDYVGGSRGLLELQKRVGSGEMALAFSLYPTDIKDLIEIADAGEIMPPKSTWFEPKLRSGLIIHSLD